ncbi:hypothetical protein GOB07_30240 [Sinorhizobium meliloti]|nr:hypothetical protein [Sinorhizobium meliloti]MDX0116333.1 hypothetical protein [Sinorhizobium meliloti]MDX0378331.1 hypothetical protein [Sinorhizobium meliloti]
MISVGILAGVLLAISLFIIGWSSLKRADATQRRFQDIAFDLREVREQICVERKRITQQENQTEELRGAIGHQEQEIRRQSTRLDSFHPVLELIRLPLLSQRLAELVDNAHRRKNSYFEAAKNPQEGMLADYSQYLTQALGDGYRHLFKIDGRNLDENEARRLIQKQFETPAADKDPHSHFPEMEEFPNDAVRHQMRRVDEYYARAMGHFEDARKDIEKRLAVAERMLGQG